MGSLLGGSYSPESHHLHILQSVVVNSEPGRYLYRSYGRSFNGFAAWLTEQEQENLSKKQEILSVFPSQPLQLHTTRSWDFMGLTKSSDVGYPTVQSDMVIGVLDSGIWPESESFSDDGFGPIPKRWKGACHGGANFTCNRKIVGARWYGDDPGARDTFGHGTHVASIAAGNKVKGISYYNLAGGTARGGVPSSRIAVYRFSVGSTSADLLAAFDDATADGVDVITISMGYGNDGSSILEDPISIGAFHAMANNIVTVNSAGNSGPDGATIGILSPWVVSVGASTTDRKFQDKVVLADGRTLTGNSINSFTMGGEPKYPLIYGKKFNSSCNDSMSKLCVESCLDKRFLKGKILMCNDPEAKFYSYNLTGAAGLITLSDNKSSNNFQLPGLALSSPAFEQLVNYYTNTKEPRATILKSETVKDDLAPVVAHFSSRGPNTLFPEIMKPDVVAPGVEILAAFPPNIPPTFDPSDARRVKYNIFSGTSMSCPHAAGAISYVKSLHPDWSPSYLKSALMTTGNVIIKSSIKYLFLLNAHLNTLLEYSNEILTNYPSLFCSLNKKPHASARPLNASLHLDREFAYGSGHIDPVKAADPGLVFDISKEDYKSFLCNVYDNAVCHKISGADCRCSKDKTPLTDFNYPALAARINGTSRNINVNFTRTVTNVGHPHSTYKAEVTADLNLEILVVPNALSFQNLNEKHSFVVTVTGAFPSGSSKMLSSLLVWGDGDHIVRSPIVIYSADFVQSH
uniref:Uncharacterized protein n=1 Tax=Kalanchoe fedtschenkoi TaxID=63787 RepID=A0A7N0ZW02_KALFE